MGVWSKVRTLIKKFAIAAAWVYFSLLPLWAALYLLAGDRFVVAAIVNMIAVYLFVPLPIIVLIAILTMRRELLYGSAIAILTFAGMWGRLFLPVGASLSPAGAPGQGALLQRTRKQQGARSSLGSRPRQWC
jgi:hypothetical protein